MFARYVLGDALTTQWLLADLLVGGITVVVVAFYLTRLADRFAIEWGLGKAFVGMLLLATVTSLPEVVTGATAGAIGAVDMAFAAVYGSCAFNIVIIAIMNLFYARGGSVLGSASPGQVLSSSFGIIMITFSLMAMSTVRQFADHPAVQQSVETGAFLTIIVTYMMFMSLAQKFERRNTAAPYEETEPTRPMGLLVRIIFLAILTIAAAWWVTQTGDILADHPIDALGGRKLGKTVVGICFLAVATSLPEIATSITAIRMNNLDMALGNVFGSNMFNMLVLPVVKVFAWFKGDRLIMSGDNFSPDANMFAGLLPIILTGVAVAGMAYRTRRRIMKLGVDSILLVLVYAGGMYVIIRQSE